MFYVKWRQTDLEAVRWSAACSSKILQWNDVTASRNISFLIMHEFFTSLRCLWLLNFVEQFDYIDWDYIPLAASMFACPECRHNFSQWRILTAHLWRAHVIDMELYACDQCSFKTNSYSKLVNLHKRIHGVERPFLCDNCGKGFKTSKQLRNHKVRLYLFINLEICLSITTCSLFYVLFNSLLASKWLASNQISKIEFKYSMYKIGLLCLFITPKFDYLLLLCNQVTPVTYSFVSSRKAETWRKKNHYLRLKKLWKQYL